jgi:hypothetical protein
MAKSIRSKIKKRLRTAKRQRIDAMVCRPQVQEHFQELKKVSEGRSVRLLKPKNAFKYPETEGACFPQHEIMKPIDFRASNMPMAGYTFRGNRRKYDGEQAEYMKNLALTSHPKMEVLAGGGAILAKTGKRVSRKESELIATAAVRPEVAAIEMAGPADASSAVAAALAEEDAEQMSADSVPVAESDANKVDADNSRRPLVKDTSRTQRQRARPNSVKKKTKAAPPRSDSTPKAVGTSVPAVATPVTSGASDAVASGKKKKKAPTKAESAVMETD